MTKYKAMYKNELANAAGVSVPVFKKWCKLHCVELVKLGYTNTNKLLPPAAVKYICEVFAIDL